MSDKPPKEADANYDSYLKGTTYRVYRYLVKQREPVGISQVQKALGLSSSSVSEYHIKKLVQLGLAKEEGGGYVVDRVVMENIVRIRRVSIPTHTGYALFFGTTLLFLLLALRPDPISALFTFAVLVNLFALGISVYEVVKTLRKL